MPQISDRVKTFTDSVIRRMTRISNKYGAINLSQGFPDFEPPKEILEFIVKDLDRGATCWEGTGIYDNTKTYITYIALSRYELHKLEKFMEVTKQDIFLVKNDFVGVDGNFKKRLSK